MNPVLFTNSQQKYQDLEFQINIELNLTSFFLYELQQLNFLGLPLSVVEPRARSALGILKELEISPT